MKRCSRCKIEKPFNEFNKSSKNKDGHQNMCKICRKQYREDNKDKITLKDKEYALANKDKIAKYARSYRENNLEKLKDYEQSYRIRNKENIRRRQKEYHQRNKIKITLRVRQYYLRNIVKISRRCKQNYRANKASVLARVNKRRALKIKASPKWLTKTDYNAIKELYICAQMFRLYTGQDYHVDHIVPLMGKTVCGLHVPWNLQVIPASENLSKSNKLQEL